MNNYPIELSKEIDSLFLCTWNGGEIIEIHTISSMKKEYGQSNLFDADEFRYFFDTDLSFEEYLLKMANSDYHIFDNMEIRRIK
jgi:hypothetical protein